MYVKTTNNNNNNNSITKNKRICLSLTKPRVLTVHNIHTGNEKKMQFTLSWPTLNHAYCLNGVSHCSFIYFLFLLLIFLCCCRANNVWSKMIFYWLWIKLPFIVIITIMIMVIKLLGYCEKTHAHRMSWLIQIQQQSKTIILKTIQKIKVM